jgi:acetyl-CoA carboxylase carboxyltransferase component
MPQMSKWLTRVSFHKAGLTMELRDFHCFPLNPFDMSSSRGEYRDMKREAERRPASTDNREHFEHLVSELRSLEERLREGGGAERIARQHSQKKLTARERINRLVDPGTYFQEIGLLVAYDKYDGQAPAAGVVTGLGVARGRELVVVANDATVKAGAWWPETITKILRAQEVAMRCRVPIVYLVDSAGVNLPYQGGVFPGQYGAARIFHYNSIMRRYLKVPQIAAVMGQCVAGGAYLPALSDVILMVEGTSFMGLGGPNLVKGATGQKVDGEILGGAQMHNAVSGVAHYLARNDEECIDRIRDQIGELPPIDVRFTTGQSVRSSRPATDLYDIIPADHRAPYDARAMLDCLLDENSFEEFQEHFAREMITGHARVAGISVGVIANSRGLIQRGHGQAPKFGGIIYSESAEKTAYFIETCNRHGTPLLFVQDVSGFMVGVDAEQSGIIRAGARFVEAMSTATVPKIVLTVNHASGAGYYAMAGQGFDPDFIFTLPTGRMAVMEGESAVMALFSGQLDRIKAEGRTPDEKLRQEMDRVRAEYERQLDARHAGARGFVDAVLAPEDVREALTLALRTSLNNPGSHIGPFGISF